MNEEIFNSVSYAKFDEYSSDNLIEGILKNGSKIQISQVLTQSYDEMSIEFMEMFVKAEIPKNSINYLSITMDKYREKITQLFKLRFPHLKIIKVNFGYLKFKDFYDVYSTDIFETKRIFTINVMDEFIDFYNKTNIKFEIDVMGKDVYIKFECGYMFGKQRLKRYSLDKDTLYKYYRMIDFSLKFINELL